MGNWGEIAQWLEPGGSCLLRESQWRGPRRLHAVFTTAADWASTRVESVRAPKWRYRHTTKLNGLIRLRMADNRTIHVWKRDTSWLLVRKSEESGPSGAVRDPDRSTKQYVIASEMITGLGHAGSVLVVASTRAQAQQVAQGLAASCDEQPTLAPLVDFVRQQLGDDHPLVATLRHGVGFHHAGLPVEILEALEAAVRDDTLPYLTCTSTLTDGVDLPVRTVVIYDHTYANQPPEEQTAKRALGQRHGPGRARRQGNRRLDRVGARRPPDPTRLHGPQPGCRRSGRNLITDHRCRAGVVRRTRDSAARGRGRRLHGIRPRRRFHQLRLACTSDRRRSTHGPRQHQHTGDRQHDTGCSTVTAGSRDL